MTAIAAVVVRRHPTYELVEYSQLSAEVQDALRPLTTDPEFFGVLRPLVSGPTIQAVCRSTALLWHHLTEPGPLPEYLLRGTDAEELRRSLADLLAAGVIQRWDGTEWTSRPVDPGTIALTTDPLSRAALVHAAHLVRMGEDDPLRLSGVLYGFHHEPLDPAWRRSMTSTAQVLAAVGMDWTPEGWTRSMPAADDPWVRWSPPFRRRARCKVYVSPALGAAATVLPGVARAAVAIGAAGFKVGGTPRGLARPDRFLVYLTDRSQVDELLDRGGVAGVPGRGVPFTASLDAGRGMFSLGTDGDGSALAWLGGSWRRRVTDTLAGAMVREGTSAAVSELLAAAAAAAARSGIDPRSWEPAA